MKKLLRPLALILLLTLLCAGLSGCKYIGAMTGTGETLYLYNYGDYMDPDLIAAFEIDTGIAVVQDCFDTNESMYPIIESGQVAYDLVVAGDYTIEKMIEHDLLQPINKDNLSNYCNLNSSYMELLAEADPGNRYAVPYTWGTVGILYNTTMIPEGSITSWTDLWNPAYASSGILMMDSLRDTFMVAEMILGYDMNTTDEAELQQVVELLLEQEPLVAAYENDAARDTLITESAGMGMIYSGEYLYCTEENENLAFCVPVEGTNVWFDCFVIPQNAKNVSAAEKFINFMLEAEAGLATYEYLGYPTPNAATAELLSDEELSDLNIFPDREILSRCSVYHYLGSEADELLATYWKKFRGN